MCFEHQLTDFSFCWVMCCAYCFNMTVYVHECDTRNILDIYIFKVNMNSKLTLLHVPSLIVNKVLMLYFSCWISWLKVTWHTTKYGYPYSEFMLCIYPSKVHTHSSEHTHTPWTHTRSSGQPFMLRRPGSSWGFGALLKDTSVVVLKEERALNIHSPHLPLLPDLRLEHATFRLRVRLSNH